MASVGWRAIPTRPAATQGQGGTVPPPPPPLCSPPFLVQARSTPVASHTFTRLIFHPCRPIQFLEYSHSLFWECPNYSHGFLMIFSPLPFPPSNLFVLGKWLRRKWFNRRRMPPMWGGGLQASTATQDFHSFTATILPLTFFVIRYWTTMCGKTTLIAININQRRGKKTTSLVSGDCTCLFFSLWFDLPEVLLAPLGAWRYPTPSIPIPIPLIAPRSYIHPKMVHCYIWHLMVQHPDWRNIRKQCHPDDWMN